MLLSAGSHNHFPLANTNIFQPRWLGFRRLFSPRIFPGINRMRSIASVSNCPPFSGQRCLPCTLLLIRPAWISLVSGYKKKYPWARFLSPDGLFFIFLLHGAFPWIVGVALSFLFPPCLYQYRSSCFQIIFRRVARGDLWPSGLLQRPRIFGLWSSRILIPFPFPGPGFLEPRIETRQTAKNGR